MRFAAADRMHIKQIRIPGESRDPLRRAPGCGAVDPGFRRECDLFLGLFQVLLVSVVNE
jgi:hypothetical protein